MNENVRDTCGLLRQKVDDLQSAIDEIRRKEESYKEHITNATLIKEEFVLKMKVYKPDWRHWSRSY